MSKDPSTLPVVAAFDFDQTLTYHDTLLPFLFSVSGYPAGFYKLAMQTPKLIVFLLKKASRQEIKESYLTRFIGGMSKKEALDKGERFARQAIQKRLKPAALQRLQWHKDQGHRCVLVSANLDLYLHPWGKIMGFDEIITSECHVDDRQILTGKLRGLNCWGPEKVRRLNEKMGPRNQYTLYAYGDSEGDRELLAFADFPFFRTFS